MTHIETSAHILNPFNSQSMLKDISLAHLHGLVYLADISSLIKPGDKTISPEFIRIVLEKIDLPINVLAIKTKSFPLPENYDF